jgi:uncharacterized protein YabE (DUF348 family)
LPEKPSRAPVFLLEKQGSLGRLQGAELSKGSLLRSRRVLHLSLITLVAVGALLFAALGPVGAGSSPDRTRLALNDGLYDHIGGASAVAAGVAMTPAPDAVPVTLHEEGLEISTTAAAPTVGEALTQKGIVLGRGDYIFPDRASPLTAGTNIFIYHANDVSLVVDGQTAETRTRKVTVAGLLSEAGITLGPEDRVEPPLDTPLIKDTTVRVVRVREGIDTVEEGVPRETIYQDDPSMDQGDSVVLQPGADGLIRRSYRVVYEDGQEAQRELLDESEVQPEPEIVARGTRPVNMVDTPAGPLRYRESLRVYATWYNPASAGRSPDSPWYGIAATGVPVHKGIVAVDPNVIPLGSRMYIPGYGEGVAADTGWAVVGNIIDLGFADYEESDWHSGWVEIYILE